LDNNYVYKNHLIIIINLIDFVFDFAFNINRKMDPKYSALFTSVNLLLGVGPLILPHSFF